MSHVNGLRALAIILVVLYHLDATLCPCGYFGVDVFLVISGYFLFSKELAPARVADLRYGSYLLKKTWRLAPPALAVALLTVAVCSFIMIQDLFGMALFTLMSTCAGVSNEYVAHSGNYFSPDTQSNPLMHFWYIGLIFQIYLFFPLVAKLMRRLSTAVRGTIWAVIGLSSFALSLYLNYGDKWGADYVTVYEWRWWFSPYYSLLTRLWEPMVAMLVLFLPAMSSRFGILRGLLSLVGVGLIVGSCYYYDTGSAAAYCAIMGAVLLVQYGGSGPVGYVLRFAPVQWIGTISFSLYLVHWPVFAVWRYVTYGVLDAQDMWTAVAASLALSWVIWYGVETRCGGWFRAASRRSVAWITSTVPVSIIIAVLLFMPGSLLTHLLPNAQNEYHASLDFPFATKYANSEQIHGFPSVFTDTPLMIGDNDAAPISFLLMGDSHSWHLYFGLDKHLCQRKNRCGIYLNNSCLPAWDTFMLLGAGDSRWDRERGERLVEWVASRKDIKLVIISNYWNLRLRDTDIQTWDMQPIAGDKARAHLEEGLREMCRRLKAAGKEVVVVRDTPFGPRENDHVERFLREDLLGRHYELVVQTPEQYKQRSAPEEPFMQSLQDEGCAIVLDANSSLMEDGVYPIRLKDGDFLYRDTNHLSARGSDLVSEYILNWIEEHEKKAAAPQP